MISKKYVNELQFNTIEDFYNYIVETEINGNNAQYKEFIKKLSKQQFKNFIVWLELDNIQIQKAYKTRC